MLKEKKDKITKRRIAYIYLMHRMFEGDPNKMVKILQPSKDVSIADLLFWDKDYKAAVYQTIQEEDSRGVKLKDVEDVPSIKSIKEKVLRRCDVLINTTDDPARLAQVYKILSEFELSDDKKEKSVLDAITESIKPTRHKKEENVTLIEKMRRENGMSGGEKRAARAKKNKEVQGDEQPLIDLIHKVVAEEEQEEKEETDNAEE